MSSSKDEPIRLIPLEEVEEGQSSVRMRKNFSLDDMQFISNGLTWKSLGEKIKKKKTKKRLDPTIPSDGQTRQVLSLSDLRQQLREKLKNQFPVTTLFVMFVGIITAFIGVFIDFCIREGLWSMRAKMYTKLAGSSGGSVFGQYIVWLLFLGINLAIGVFVTIRFSPAAGGSGIPEIKTILSGGSLNQFLAFKTLVIKVVGLIFAVGSGASLGKVGPSVHLGTLVVNNMAQLPLFEKIKKNAPLMQQLLGVGCAVGYACSLGTPIGGVLLSIEVTSTYYPVRNYWYTYVGTISGAVTFLYFVNFLATQSASLTPLIQTNIQGGLLRFGVMELAIFTTMGALIGVLAVGFIKLNAFAILQWRAFTKKYAPYEKKYRIKSPYVLVIIITILTGTLTFPGLAFFGDHSGLPAFASLGDLFTAGEMDEEGRANDWSLNHKDQKIYLVLSLTLFAAVKYFLTAVSVVLTIPCGLYAPVLAVGGAIGRIFGEMARIMFAMLEDLLFTGVYIVPGGYAVVGAAAFAGAVTHTQSSAMVIFELTGQFQYVLPVLVSVITAIAVAKKLYPLSIYDSISKLKSLPYLPDISNENAYDVTAKDIMRPDVRFIVRKFSYETVVKLLQEDLDENVFPVVENEESMILLGTVDRAFLKKVREEYFAKRRFIQQQLTYAPEAFKFDIPENYTTKYEITPVPVQLMENTPLTQIHLLFINMRLSHALVISNGKLVGRVKRTDLMKLVEKL